MSSIPIPDGPDINIAGPLVTMLWTLYGVTTVIVVLRVYTQWRITKQLGWGDFLMVLSLGCGIAFCVCTSMGYRYGLGRHFFFLAPEERVQATKWNFIGQPLSIMAATFGRMAFTLLMIQIIVTTPRRRKMLWVLFWQGLVVNGGIIVLIFGQCQDVNTLWDPVDHPGKCLSSHVQERVGFVQCGLNSLTDLILTVLPTVVVWNLRMSIRLKVGVAFLLGLSVFALVASIIKTIKLQSLGSRSDYTFNTVTFFIWVALECALVSIAASVPLIKPLFVRVKRSLGIGSTPNSNSYEMRRHDRSLGSAGKSARIVNVEEEAGIRSSSQENILTMAATNTTREESLKGFPGGSGSAIVMERRFSVSLERKDGQKRVHAGTEQTWA